MKLGSMMTFGLQAVHKRFPVKVWQYTGQKSKPDFRIDPDYFIYDDKARVLEPTQDEIKQEFNINTATNLKRFTFDKDSITGLNRNVIKGPDLIEFNGIMYQVSKTVYRGMQDYITVFGVEVAGAVGQNPSPPPVPEKNNLDPNILGA